MLAGMSVDYYAKIERGNLAGVSPEVLDALAIALRLDEAETAYLHDLPRASEPAARRRTGRAEPKVRPSVQRLLDAVTGAPAWVTNPRSDLLAVNSLGTALLAPLLDDPLNGRNNARFIFLSPAARTFYPEWEQAADAAAAALRQATGRNPHDESLTDLIGELTTRSDAFRQRWSEHQVRFHTTGIKRIHHPLVGDLELTYEGLDLPDQPGWSLYTYTSAAGSATEERLALLGSLSVTRPDHAPAADSDARVSRRRG